MPKFPVKVDSKKLATIVYLIAYIALIIKCCAYAHLLPREVGLFAHWIGFAAILIGLLTPKTYSPRTYYFLQRKKLQREERRIKKIMRH